MILPCTQHLGKGHSMPNEQIFFQKLHHMFCILMKFGTLKFCILMKILTKNQKRKKFFEKLLL